VLTLSDVAAAIAETPAFSLSASALRMAMALDTGLSVIVLSFRAERSSSISLSISEFYSVERNTSLHRSNA
jgi:hypothetical protein